MKSHKDVEFAVNDASGRQRTFRKFAEAAAFAVAVAATGRKVNLDVLVMSVAGARAYAGDEGVRLYREDPDASVFDRVVIRAESIGMVR